MIEQKQSRYTDDLKTRLCFSPETGEIHLDSKRMIMVHTEAMGSLRRELIETLGRDRARGVLLRMGYASGASDARFTRRLYPNASDNDCLKLGPIMHRLEGKVNSIPVRFEMDAARGYLDGEFIWEKSFEAEVHMEDFGVDIEPTCWMLTGYACGYSSTLMGKSVLYKEVECAGKGDTRCRIIGKPADEWEDAEDYMKYFQPDQVADRLIELQTQVERLRSSLQEENKTADLIGDAESFRASLKMIDMAASSQVTVLLLGETGVGKEILSRRLHNISPRENGAFIAINCAAIPDDLIESELFGVEKGAFTGATRSRPGRFERAHRGSLFLDEVGELSAGAQVKLLRVLQEGEFERVGDTKTRKVDVRLICATNTDLQQAVDNGTFREDLFYRLNIYPVIIPPLRDRLEDIPELVKYFVDKESVRHGKKITGVTREAIDALMMHSWPGNIRELENMIERGVILTLSGSKIETEQLFGPFYSANHENLNKKNVEQSSELEKFICYALENRVEIDDIEKRMLKSAVKKCNDNLSEAARLLGITRPQLAYRLQNKP